jgi:hypothetical protein
VCAGSDVMLGIEGAKVMERSVMGEVVLVSFLSFALRSPFFSFVFTCRHNIFPSSRSFNQAF